MIEIVKPLVSLVEKASRVPDLGDEKLVSAYVESMAPEIGQIVARVVNAIRSGQLGLIGEANIADEIQTEIEIQQAKAVNPIVIQVIVMVVMKIVEILIRKRS